MNGTGGLKKKRVDNFPSVGQLIVQLTHKVTIIIIIIISVRDLIKVDYRPCFNQADSSKSFDPLFCFSGLKKNSQNLAVDRVVICSTQSIGCLIYEFVFEEGTSSYNKKEKKEEPLHAKWPSRSDERYNTQTEKHTHTV